MIFHHADIVLCSYIAFHAIMAVKKNQKSNFLAVINKRGLVVVVVASTI